MESLKMWAGPAIAILFLALAVSSCIIRFVVWFRDARRIGFLKRQTCPFCLSIGSVVKRQRPGRHDHFSRDSGYRSTWTGYSVEDFCEHCQRTIRLSDSICPVCYSHARRTALSSDSTNPETGSHEENWLWTISCTVCRWSRYDIMYSSVKRSHWDESS